tara:strand:- start:1360 stop:2124 length:765 start_codon:yes stop_codon:yes gene_type:complete
MSSRAFNIADHMKNLQGTRTLASGAKIVGADADSIQAPGLLTIAGGGVNANLSTTTGVSHIKMSGTNHTFDFKVVNQPITGATNSTNNDANSDQLAIYNGSTKLWGITEDGYVVNPNRPLFQAYANESGTGLNNKYSNEEGQFNGVVSNVGNHYDGSKRFTAPIAGHYQFHCSLLTGNANGFGIFRFNVNGAAWTGSNRWFQAYNYTSGNDKTVTGSIIINLSAGDYVSVFINDSHDHFYWGGTYSYFGGYLLG